MHIREEESEERASTSSEKKITIPEGSGDRRKYKPDRVIIKEWDRTMRSIRETEDFLRILPHKAISNDVDSVHRHSHRIIQRYPSKFGQDWNDIGFFLTRRVNSPSRNINQEHGLVFKKISRELWGLSGTVIKDYDYKVGQKLRLS
ncbi:hypothetical protein Tco_0780745 [Tanacetum coccineum]|uniref:Uncharacterized protein n=1 Tax=Tanacetum coccineum TaxID=301880 RepID=A0ABQ4Z0C0_9ASTR